MMVVSKQLHRMAMGLQTGQGIGMPLPRKPANPFRYFHSSPEVIRLAVMLYARFPLSLRNVEDLLFEHGIDVCHETVRLSWNRFGPLFAADIRRQRINSWHFMTLATSLILRTSPERLLAGRFSRLADVPDMVGVRWLHVPLRSLPTRYRVLKVDGR